MRIAIVTAGTGAGGTERVIFLLARNWIERGWSISLHCFEKPGTTPYYPLPPQVRLIQHHVPRKRALLSRATYWAKRARMLRQSLKAEAPDVVVSFLTKYNVLTMLAMLGSRTPVIICERNNPERQDAHRTWRKLQEILGRRVLLVLETEGSRAAFPVRLSERAMVIPNPVELDRSEPMAQSSSIVAVGRLVHQKGFDLLLNAFAGVAGRIAGWNLVIWGDGPERARLERLRDQLGLHDRVLLPGTSKDHGAWVHSGSIFVLSSRFEGFPNVLIEAMASRMAVLSTDCPWGPAEIIEDRVSGVLVPEGDVQALGTQIVALVNDPALRAELGASARRRMERFALPVVLAQWDVALSAACGSNKGRGR